MKKARVFSSEFKAAAVRRMKAGESPTKLARELKLRRKLLYQWRDAVLAGRPLRRSGRPRQGPEERRSEGLAGRVQELEQLLGQLTAENRFFKGALQRIKELRRQSGEAGGGASWRRSRL